MFMHTHFANQSCLKNRWCVAQKAFHTLRLPAAPVRCRAVSKEPLSSDLWWHTGQTSQHGSEYPPYQSACWGICTYVSMYVHLYTYVRTIHGLMCCTWWPGHGSNSPPLIKTARHIQYIRTVEANEDRRVLHHLTLQTRAWMNVKTWEY